MRADSPLTASPYRTSASAALSASFRRVQGCAGCLTQCATWPILVVWVAFRPEPPLPCGGEQLPSHQTERKA